MAYGCTRPRTDMSAAVIARETKQFAGIDERESIEERGEEAEGWA